MTTSRKTPSLGIHFVTTAFMCLLIMVITRVNNSLRTIVRSRLNVKRWYSLTTSLHLNRILVDQSECTTTIDGEYIVSLGANDDRTKHVSKILKSSVGDTIRCGVINEGINNSAVITHCSPDNVVISLGSKDKLKINERPNVDLILAVPRPIRLEKLLPVISCVGVGSLTLIGASKVNPDYFGSKLVQSPETCKAGLVEGLMQAEVDCLLPTVRIYKSLKAFFSRDIDKLFPLEETNRYIAHPELPPLPGQSQYPVPSKRLHQLDKSMIKRRSVVVVGPEGGWEISELELFVSHSFEVINVGPRILRTDIAVPLVLGLLHEQLDAVWSGR